LLLDYDPNISYDLSIVNTSYEKKSMGRKKRWSEDMVARFEAGTFERMDAVRGEDEDRTDFIREAVERELKRRERKG
jgi:hypothetical protein